jgi:hypothetical protein
MPAIVIVPRSNEDAWVSLPLESTLIVADASTVPICTRLPRPIGSVIDSAVDTNEPSVLAVVDAVAEEARSVGWLVAAIPAVALDDEAPLWAFNV